MSAETGGGNASRGIVQGGMSHTRLVSRAIGRLANIMDLNDGTAYSCGQIAGLVNRHLTNDRFEPQRPDHHACYFTASDSNEHFHLRAACLRMSLR